jgi:hypothetical protein
MSKQGLGWTASEIRQAQLVEWIVPQQNAANYVPVKPFYEALSDQSANTNEIAHADLQRLGQQGLLDLALGLGGMEAFDVRVTAEARELAEQRQAARADRSQRRTACRVAMVDWLYSVEAVSELNLPVRNLMLDSPAHGVWYGQPFTEGDIDGAAAWLFRNGYVKGITIDQAEGPVRLYLTDAGVECAERYDSDVDRYSEARRMQGSGMIVSFGGSNYGQVAGDYAHQVQNNVGATADELRKQIVAIAELVRSLVPEANGIDTQRDAALAAARDGAVNRSVLQRFADWALSVVRQGATAAVVPAVASATTAMLMEAGRLTGHL